MQTILIELLNSKAFEALHHLEKEDLIWILDEDVTSYCLPGKSLNKEEFKAWVKYAENTPTLTLNEAKEKWEIRKKKFKKIIK
jgi:hypothetical protein